MSDELSFSGLMGRKKDSYNPKSEKPANENSQDIKRVKPTKESISFTQIRKVKPLSDVVTPHFGPYDEGAFLDSDIPPLFESDEVLGPRQSLSQIHPELAPVISILDELDSSMLSVYADYETFSPLENAEVHRIDSILARSDAVDDFGVEVASDAQLDLAVIQAGILYAFSHASSEEFDCLDFDGNVEAGSGIEKVSQAMRTEGDPLYGAYIGYKIALSKLNRPELDFIFEGGPVADFHKTIESLGEPLELLKRLDACTKLLKSCNDAYQNVSVDLEVNTTILRDSPGTKEFIEAKLAADNLSKFEVPELLNMQTYCRQIGALRKTVAYQIVNRLSKATTILSNLSKEAVSGGVLSEVSRTLGRGANGDILWSKNPEAFLNSYNELATYAAKPQGNKVLISKLMGMYLSSDLQILEDPLGGANPMATGYSSPPSKTVSKLNELHSRADRSKKQLMVDAANALCDLGIFAKYDNQYRPLELGTLRSSSGMFDFDREPSAQELALSAYEEVISVIGAPTYRPKMLSSNEVVEALGSTPLISRLCELDILKIENSRTYFVGRDDYENDYPDDVQSLKELSGILELVARPTNVNGVLEHLPRYIPLTSLSDDVDVVSANQKLSYLIPKGGSGQYPSPEKFGGA